MSSRQSTMSNIGSALTNRTVYLNKKRSGRRYKKGPKKYAQAVGKYTLFPTRKVAWMKYVGSGGCTTAAVQSTFGSSTSFWLNAIRQPKTSGPVNNVQGYDQIKLIYGKYKVLRAKVHVEITNPTADGIYFGARLHESGSINYIGGKTLQDAEMGKFTKAMPISNTGNQVTHINFDVSTPTIDGLTKNQFNSDITQYNSAILSQPALKPWIELSACNTVDTTQPVIAFKITIMFLVELNDRAVLPVSTV